MQTEPTPIYKHPIYSLLTFSPFGSERYGCLGTLTKQGQRIWLQGCQEIDIHAPQANERSFIMRKGQLAFTQYAFLSLTHDFQCQFHFPYVQFYENTALLLRITYNSSLCAHIN